MSYPTWTTPWMERYALHVAGERGLSPPTVRNYLTDLAPFFAFLNSLGLRDLERVAPPLLRRYLHWLLTEAKVTARGGRMKQEAYASRSVVRKLSALRSLFRFLVREGVVAQDPTARLFTMKLEQRLPDFLDRESVVRLLEAPNVNRRRGVRDRAILELLYASGLRVSELVGLNLGDVDPDRRQVRALGKGAKVRLVPFGRPAAQALARYLEWARPWLQGRRQEQALFLNRFGGRLTQRSVQSLVRRYAIKEGLDPTTHPHTLRHTFATHLLDGGADLRVVQELMGHTTPVTTQIYTHVTQSQARKVYLSAHPRARQSDPPDPSA